MIISNVLFDKPRRSTRVFSDVKELFLSPFPFENVFSVVCKTNLDKNDVIPSLFNANVELKLSLALIAFVSFFAVSIFKFITKSIFAQKIIFAVKYRTF